jgi:hypothetical protein
MYIAASQEANGYMYSIFRPIDRIILILMLRAIPPPASTSSLTIGFAPVQSPDSGASRRLNLAQCENQRDAGRRGDARMLGATHDGISAKNRGQSDLAIQRFRTDHGLIAANGKQACWRRSRLQQEKLCSPMSFRSTASGS